MNHETDRTIMGEEINRVTLGEGDSRSGNRTEMAQRLASLMVVANRTFMLDLHRKLKELGISYQHYHLLGYLENDGLPIMREISEKLNVSDAAVTQIVDTLEKGGWARRIPHVEDRRKIAVQITAEGRTVLVEIQETIQELIAQAMAATDQGLPENTPSVFGQVRAIMDPI